MRNVTRTYKTEQNKKTSQQDVYYPLANCMQGVPSLARGCYPQRGAILGRGCFPQQGVPSLAEGAILRGVPSLGGTILGGYHPWGGGSTGSDIMEPPVNIMADGCKNITFPQLLLRPVTIFTLHSKRNSVLLNYAEYVPQRNKVSTSGCGLEKHQ